MQETLRQVRMTAAHMSAHENVEEQIQRQIYSSIQKGMRRDPFVPCVSW